MRAITEERIWAALIQWKFNRQDAKQIDAILTAIQTNNIGRNAIQLENIPEHLTPKLKKK